MINKINIVANQDNQEKDERGITDVSEGGLFVWIP